MNPKYSYELLPLDTPDDDPIWAAYLDIFNFGFLDSRASAAAVTNFLQHRRVNQARLGMVTAEGPGLAGKQPVAAFNSIPITINCGAGLVDSLLIATIVVRASHRRRGLLATMMRHQLDAAKADGKVLATLTASEATIYGRFGFGPALNFSGFSVDTRRFALRPDVAVAPGSIEFIDPSFLKDHLFTIAEQHQRRYRGAVALNHAHWLYDTGQWDHDEAGPSKKMRAVLHFDPSGRPDGYAVFVHKGLSESPITTEVRRLVSPDPAIDRALWQALATIDLVEKLTYGIACDANPLALSLTDPWAVKKMGGNEPVWLRILDLPAAVSQRAFDADGSIVIAVSDAMGYIDGTWQITAREGVGVAERVAAEPQIRLDASALASLWHGHYRATDLAQAGLIQGEPADIARFSTLMMTVEAPANVATF